MITEKKSLSLSETKDVLESLEETDKIKDAKAFIKKYSKIAPEKAKKMREAINSLGLLKLKDADISRIIDMLPSDSVELNKIFTEISLDSDETNKILEAVKQNK